MAFSQTDPSSSAAASSSSSAASWISLAVCSSSSSSSNTVVSATKVAGLLLSAYVAFNAITFYGFKRKNFRPVPKIVDEDADTLAEFNINPKEGEDGFFFGLATAPGHVEDDLRDIWLKFAEDRPCTKSYSKQQHLNGNGVIDSLATNGKSNHVEYKATNGKYQNGAVEADYVKLNGASHQEAAVFDYTKSNGECHQERKMTNVSHGKNQNSRKNVGGSMRSMVRGMQKLFKKKEAEPSQCCHNVAAWHNVPIPNERLRFWSDPDTELKLAKDTGVTVFRMGVDWARIMPVEPVNGIEKSIDWAALERYKWIVQRVRSYGMKVMMTLFHHSVPPWAIEYGGWRADKTVEYFMEFTRVVVDYMADLVDYWITFNEPNVFCLLTYFLGAWPGGTSSPVAVLTAPLPMGILRRAMNRMAMSHRMAYDYIHEKSPPHVKVGISHHCSYVRPYYLFDMPAVLLARFLSVFAYMDDVYDKLDFMGMNYYGQEVMHGGGVKLVETDEYSDSGRVVYPDGLYLLLLQFHERYKKYNVPFIISENGLSDASDLIRRPYIVEHLLAIDAAIQAGIRVLGFVFWTISDNWEWGDGYGPKFGLVAVDRANGLARIPRPSYFLFSRLASTGKVTRQERARAWSELQDAAKNRKARPFYRVVTKYGLMRAGGLDKPNWRHFVDRDWRFGHYEMEGLQDPLCRFLRFVAAPFSRSTKTSETTYGRSMGLQCVE